MNINRTNYEEYFLLYADKELSPSEKNEVEAFVKQHNDLEAEFNMIKLTVHSPDEMVNMPDKSSLIKKSSSSFINENNYEAIFVLYHDQELSNDQEKDTETFLHLNPHFATEFELIKKSKLFPQKEILYPNKNKLFKKEKAGKTVSVILWRSLAAATLIGFGIWITLPYFNLQKSTTTVAPGGSAKESSTAVSKNNADEEAAPDENSGSHSFSIKEQEKNHLRDEKENSIPKLVDKRYTATKRNEKTNPVPEEKTIYIKHDDLHEIIAANDPIKIEPDKIVRTTSKIPSKEIVQQVSMPNINHTEAIQVNNTAYTAENENDENYVFYNVKRDEFYKTKVGGLFKKVKRMIERNNPISRLTEGVDEQFASK